MGDVNKILETLHTILVCNAAKGASINQICTDFRELYGMNFNAEFILPLLRQDTSKFTFRCGLWFPIANEITAAHCEVIASSGKKNGSKKVRGGGRGNSSSYGAAFAVAQRRGRGQSNFSSGRGNYRGNSTPFSAQNVGFPRGNSAGNFDYGGHNGNGNQMGNGNRGGTGFQERECNDVGRSYSDNFERDSYGRDPYNQHDDRRYDAHFDHPPGFDRRDSYDNQNWDNGHSSFGSRETPFGNNRCSPAPDSSSNSRPSFYVPDNYSNGSMYNRESTFSSSNDVPLPSRERFEPEKQNMDSGERPPGNYNRHDAPPGLKPDIFQPSVPRDSLPLNRPPGLDVVKPAQFNSTTTAQFNSSEQSSPAGNPSSTLTGTDKSKKWRSDEIMGKFAELLKEHHSQKYICLADLLDRVSAVYHLNLHGAVERKGGLEAFIRKGLPKQPQLRLEMFNGEMCLFLSSTSNTPIPSTSSTASFQVSSVPSTPTPTPGQKLAWERYLTIYTFIKKNGGCAELKDLIAENLMESHSKFMSELIRKSSANEGLHRIFKVEVNPKTKLFIDEMPTGEIFIEALSVHPEFFNDERPLSAPVNRKESARSSSHGHREETTLFVPPPGLTRHPDPSRLSVQINYDSPDDRKVQCVEDRPRILNSDDIAHHVLEQMQLEDLLELESMRCRISFIGKEGLMGDFYVTLENDRDAMEANQMMMRSVWRDPQSVNLDRSGWCENDVAILKEGNRYFRVSIGETNLERNEAYVFFLDIGENEWVNISSIYPLPAELASNALALRVRTRKFHVLNKAVYETILNKFKDICTQQSVYNLQLSEIESKQPRDEQNKYFTIVANFMFELDGIPFEIPSSLRRHKAIYFP